LSETIHIPLLSKLIPDGIKSGTMFSVEFDPDSQWFSVASTIAARFLEEKRHVAYLAMATPPDDVAYAISTLGIDVGAAENSGLLAIEDWYSASLAGGRVEPANPQGPMFERIDGRMRVRSLKVADLSVEWLKTSKAGPTHAHDIVEFWPAGSLAVSESCSVILRFNEEKAFVELFESRIRPEERKRKNLITLQGLMRGVHSDWLYKRMENASDGIIDLRVIEREDEVDNLLRVRNLRGQPHDSRWHKIEVMKNGEARLTT
jgi:KaiC/GvpD/RAD55 family RecA-like ATPase